VLYFTRPNMLHNSKILQVTWAHVLQGKSYGVRRSFGAQANPPRDPHRPENNQTQTIQNREGRSDPQSNIPKQLWQRLFCDSLLTKLQSCRPNRHTPPSRPHAPLAIVYCDHFRGSYRPLLGDRGFAPNSAFPLWSRSHKGAPFVRSCPPKPPQWQRM
jgi:hypothetical protein